MSVVNGSCYLLRTLLSGYGAQGGARVEVVEVETQEAAAAELIQQQGLALLKHIWGDVRREDEIQDDDGKPRTAGDIHQCLTNPL